MLWWTVVTACQPAVPAAERNIAGSKKIIGAALARKGIGSPHEVTLASAFTPLPSWAFDRVADLQTYNSHKSSFGPRRLWYSTMVPWWATHTGHHAAVWTRTGNKSLEGKGPYLS